MTQLMHWLTSASRGGTRSSALHPLNWLAGTVIAGLALAVEVDAPSWCLVLLGIALSVCIFIYLGVYIYFAIRNPDALRSESYTLRKLEIEHGLIGDDHSGILDVTSQAKGSPKLLSSRYRVAPVENVEREASDE